MVREALHGDRCESGPSARRRFARLPASLVRLILTHPIPDNARSTNMPALVLTNPIPMLNAPTHTHPRQKTGLADQTSLTRPPVRRNAASVSAYELTICEGRARTREDSHRWGAFVAGVDVRSRGVRSSRCTLTQTASPGVIWNASEISAIPMTTPEAR